MGSVQTGLQWAPPAWSGGCLSQYGESVQYTNVSVKEIAMECQKGRQRKKMERKLLNSDVEKGQELSEVSVAVFMNF